MKFSVCVLLVSLAGCVSASDIVPMGKDSYMVSGAGTGGRSIGKTSVAATQKANAYCGTLHKFMIPRRLETHPGFNEESTTLIFSCVLESDAEYVRPDLSQNPTPVVEAQRH